MTEVIQTMIPMIDLALAAQPVRDTMIPVQDDGAQTFDVIFDDQRPDLVAAPVPQAGHQRSESARSVFGSHADCPVMPDGATEMIARVQTGPALAVQHPTPETDPTTNAGSDGAEKAPRRVGFGLRDAVRMAMELLTHQETTTASRPEDVSDGDGPDIVLSDPDHPDIAVFAGPVPQTIAVVLARAPETPARQPGLPNDASREVGQARAIQIISDQATFSQHVVPGGEPAVQPGRSDLPVSRDRVARPESAVARPGHSDGMAATADLPHQAADSPPAATVSPSPMLRGDVAGRAGATQQPTERLVPDATLPEGPVRQEVDPTGRPVADRATGSKTSSDKADVHAPQVGLVHNPVLSEAVLGTVDRSVDAVRATSSQALPVQPPTDRPIRRAVHVETVAGAILSVAAGPMSRDAAVSVRPAMAKPVVKEADPRGGDSRSGQTPDGATTVSAATATPVLAAAPHPGGAGATMGVVGVPSADHGAANWQDILTVEADAGVFASASTAVDIPGRDPGAPISAPSASAQVMAVLVATLSDVSAAADTIALALSPEELGGVRIEFRANGDMLQVVLSAERTDTLDLLRRNADQLVAELRAAGYASATLNFGQWGSSHGGDKSLHHGRVQSQLTPDTVLSSPTSNRSFATTGGGLDIRL